MDYKPLLFKNVIASLRFIFNFVVRAFQLVTELKETVIL